MSGVRSVRDEWCKMSHEICTPGSPSAAPTTKSTRQAPAGGDNTRCTWSRRLCALHLARNLHSGLTECCACHEIYTIGTRRPAATTRAAAGPGGSVYCACHEICTPGSPSAAPATKSARQAAGGGTSWSGRLCVLRLPRNLHSGLTECCACHEIYTI